MNRTLQQRVAGRLRRAAARARQGTGTGGKDLGRQVAALRKRVAELEEEVVEDRQLARRIAELTDIVEQLLLPEEMRDPARLEQRLAQVRRRHQPH